MPDLVVVESPGKTSKIGSILGPDYVVRASLGHVRDLPETGNRPAGEWTPFDPESPDVPGVSCTDWAAHWEPLPKKARQISVLQSAGRHGTVWLATDLDREGEAIAWHLRELLGGPASRFRRVTFSEITASAVKAAFAEPRVIDQPLVDAQIARRLLDRVVGYTVSPLLGERLRQRGLSAGRVQSAALRLLADRDDEIRKFTAQPYWLVDLVVDAAGRTVRLRLVGDDGNPKRYDDHAAAAAAVAALSAASLSLSDVTSVEQRVKPSPPFTTSTLQQLASSRLKLSVENTMALAQKLYEAGFITYMRSDAVAVSPEAQEAARRWVRDNVGPEALPPAPPVYKSKAGAQEAHEAVRVTDPARPDEEVKRVVPEALALYDLVKRRFLASQMTPAVFRKTTWIVDADTPVGSQRLTAAGRVVVAPGWHAVLPPKPGKDDLQDLPDLPKGHAWPRGGRPAAVDKWTKPPQRYTEATLVAELERRGVGRPATYAQTLDVLRKRLYVIEDKRAFVVTPLGRLVCSILAARFKNVCDVAFTARVEQSLDLIAAGRMQYRAFLDAMWKRLQGELRLAAADESFQAPAPVPADLPCPSCGRSRRLRLLRRELVLACGNRDCKLGTLEWAPERPRRASAAADEADSDVQAADQRRQRRCSKCGGTSTRWSVATGGFVHLCDAWPACGGLECVAGPPSGRKRSGARRKRASTRSKAAKRRS